MRAYVELNLMKREKELRQAVLLSVPGGGKLREKHQVRFASPLKSHPAWVEPMVKRNKFPHRQVRSTGEAVNCELILIKAADVLFSCLRFDSEWNPLVAETKQT